MENFKKRHGYLWGSYGWIPFYFVEEISFLSLRFDKWNPAVLPFGSFDRLEDEFVNVAFSDKISQMGANWKVATRTALRKSNVLLLIQTATGEHIGHFRESKKMCTLSLSEKISIQALQ